MRDHSVVDARIRPYIQAIFWLGFDMFKLTGDNTVRLKLSLVEVCVSSHVSWCTLLKVSSPQDQVLTIYPSN